MFKHLIAVAACARHNVLIWTSTRVATQDPKSLKAANV